MLRLAPLVLGALSFIAVPAPAEESSSGLDAYFAAQREAAAHAAQRDAQAQQPSTRKQSVGLARALAAPGTIAIDSVSLVAPSDALAVPRFAKVELLVSIPTLSATKPFDPSPATGGLDLSAQFVGPDGIKAVKGYWDGAAWRVRFAAHAVGNWTFSVSASDSSGTATWNGGTFTCVPSDNPGFVRINGSSLEYSGTGRPFIGIGHNIGWQMQVEQPAFSGDTAATTAYGTVPATLALPATRSMKANGENLLVFWLSAPWESPTGSYPQRAMIEATSTGLGVYNQAPCRYFDQLLERAEAAGVHLLPAIWPHDAVRGTASPMGAANWSGNAYSTICAASAFTTTAGPGGEDTPQWTAQKNFFRYLTARFGYSTALAGWIGIEGLDRIDAWAVNATLARAWCRSTETWFAQHDVFRSNGTAFPITYNNMGTVVNETSLWSHNNWNSTVSHLSVANDFGTQTLQYAGKPRYINEFGGRVGSGAIQPTHLHNAIWASIAAGANLTPMVWGDGQAFPRLTDGTTGEAMQTQFLWLSQFLAQVPWAGHQSSRSAAISATGIQGWYSNASDRGYGWIYRTDGTALGTRTFTLATSHTGTYTVWWFNPNADCTAPVATSSATVTGTAITLTTPTQAVGLKDVAWHYQRHPVVDADLTHDLMSGVAYPLQLDNAPSYNWMMQAVITSLPEGVRLYHTSDGLTLGDEIVNLPAVISNPSLRVIAVSGNIADNRSFAFHLAEVGTTSAPATMTLSITNQPPSATPASATFAENTPQAITLAGSDPEMQPLTFQVQTAPAHGVLSGTAPDLIYTPTINYHGDDSFTFTVHDGVQSSAPATITLHVEHSDMSHNQLPIAIGGVFVVHKNTAYSLTLTGSDPEMQPLSFQVRTPPRHGVLSGTAPDLIYTPALGFDGSDSMTFTVSDGMLESAPATIVLTVQSRNGSRCGVGSGVFALIFLALAVLLTLRLRLGRGMDH